MTPETTPICFLCKHYVPGMDNDRGVPVCAAFPDGIPDEIMMGGHDHREPLGDESILFKLSDEYAQEDLDAWEEEQALNERAYVETALEQLE